MSRLAWLASLVGLAVGCTPASSGAPAGDSPARVASPPSTPPAVTPDKAGGERPPPPAGPSEPSFATVAKICAHPCGGNFARITVFRDASGAVGRLMFDGDLEVCSHPPRVYFDAEGHESLTIPLEPVVPDSPEAKELGARQDAQVEGLIEDERLGCPDPQMCEPSRTEGFRSEYGCRTDADCMTCQCAPVDRTTYNRRGGEEACVVPGEECRATNAACCDGRCVLSR